MATGFELGEFLAAFRGEAAARGFSEEILAQTSGGPLVAFRRPGASPGGYLSAGIHGDEPAGPLAALELLRRSVLDGPTAWALCPALNPAGLVAGTRENEQGIDLNRDYRQRRSPEVRAHAAWLERQDVPACAISLHEDWEAHGFYFYEINPGADCPERATTLRAAAGRWCGIEPAAVIDDHIVREPGWIYHPARPDDPDHWPEAIFLSARGCPLSLTLETPSAMDLPIRVAAQVAAVEALLADGRSLGMPGARECGG